MGCPRGSGPLYGTRVGMLEHKLPALYMLIPKAVLRAYPEIRETLLYNQQLVATHWVRPPFSIRPQHYF